MARLRLASNPVLEFKRSSCSVLVKSVEGVAIKLPFFIYAAIICAPFLQLSVISGFNGNVCVNYWISFLGKPLLQHYIYNIRG